MVMYEAEKYIKERCHIFCFAQNYDLHGYPVEGTITLPCGLIMLMIPMVYAS